MMREMKMTIKQMGTICIVSCQTRDDDGNWNQESMIPKLGTVEQVRVECISQQEYWGWNLYDIDENEILIFWKEF